MTPVLKGKDGKWCLLGVSRTTLVTKPVELIKRSRLEIQPTTELGSSVGSAHTDATINKSKPRKPFTVILEPDADAKQKRQAAYLEQLMAVKLARGEKDIVYLGKAMHYLDADGEKQRAPGFSKRDIDKMNEGIVLRGPNAKRRQAEADAKERGKGSDDDEDESDGEGDDAIIDAETDGPDAVEIGDEMDDGEDQDHANREANLEDHPS